MADRDLFESAASAVVSGGDPRVSLRPLVRLLQRSPEAYPAGQHVLGFHHCKVAEVNGRTLRVHIWPKDKRSYGVPTWPVHTHHWTISSAILAGHVFNETFAVSENEDGRHQLYAVKYASDGWSERQRTDTRATSTSIQLDRWNAGERYEIRLNTYHSTSVPDGVFAATAILTGKRTTTPPLVLGEASAAQSYRYPKEIVPSETWLDTLNQLLELMEAR